MYEENEMMTNYDGYWILRENLKKLQNISNRKKERIIKARTDQNNNSELTEQEELQYRRLMKKEKRRESQLLKMTLFEIQKQNKMKNKKSVKRGKPGKYLGIQFQESSDMVQFDGFFIKREAAERLEALRDKLRSKGCSEDEVWAAIKAERRKEERALKNERKIFCFQCRALGHVLAQCPQNDQSVNKGVDICFKCGSTEHMARSCPANRDGSYSHATCFVCGQEGHLSRQCPENPRGLYPNGGCCNECGSVEHLKRDCPDLQKRREDDMIKLSTFNRNVEIDALDDDGNDDRSNIRRRRDEKTRHENKIIKFDD